MEKEDWVTNSVSLLASNTATEKLIDPRARTGSRSELTVRLTVGRFTESNVRTDFGRPIGPSVSNLLKSMCDLMDLLEHVLPGSRRL